MVRTTPDPEWLDEDGNEIEDHDRGLLFDLRTLVDRRRALSLFGGLGVAGASRPAAPARRRRRAHGRTAAATAAASAATSTTTTDATTEPDRRGTRRGAGRDGRPLPGRRLERPNVLDDSGIVRSDIRRSFGSSTTAAQGVPLTIELTVADAATGAALVGRGGLPVALRPRRAVLAVQPAASRTRTTCAACRQTDATRHRARSRRSSPRATRAAGRTSTSRCTTTSRRRRRRADRQDLADRAAAGRRATTGVRDERLRAERRATSRRCRCRATTSSATTAASTRSRRCRARVAAGYTAALTIGV